MSDCEIEGGTLTVRGDLMDEFADEFKGKTLELLDADSAQLVLDMSEVHYMRSYHIGIVVALHADAVDRDKTVKILASPKLGEMFDTFDLSEVLDIEVVE